MRFWMTVLSFIAALAIVTNASAGEKKDGPKKGKPSVEERLKRLDELKAKGLLNEQEYKQKRDEILKDL